MFCHESLGKVMDDPSKVKEAVMCNGHFDLNSSKEVCVNIISGYSLGLSSKVMRRNPRRQNKGIRVPPEKKFRYTVPKEGYNLYVFEAGLSPLHAATMQKNIHIYVIQEEKRIHVATLSSAHPRVQFDLVMSGGMQIFHTSMRKVVYFNACEFKPRPLYGGSLRNLFLENNKELWVTQIKPHEEVALNPMEDEKYHLLKVFSTKVTGEKINLHVLCDDKYENIGALSPKDRTLYCSLEYDGKFNLSHTSQTADVIFFGYKVPNMRSLRELCGPPDNKFDRKPAKKSDDPEYQEFIARKCSAEHQEPKLTAVSLMSAPLMGGKNLGR